MVYGIIVRHIIIFGVVIIACSFISCNSSGNEGSTLEDLNVNLDDQGASKVQTLRIDRGVFNRELFANGKLHATNKVDLYFQMSGTIKELRVKEGQSVKEGQVIAMLRQDQQELSARQAELRYRQALLNYQDLILQAGYQMSDTLSLSLDILSVLQLRSGITASRLELEKNQSEKEFTVLRAPFSGKIANLNTAVHSYSAAFKPICTIIDDSQLEVQFQILQQELDLVTQSRTIRLSHISDETGSYSSRIISINPLIDTQGMITVRANVDNEDGRLMDGMNMNVVVEVAISDQLIVPKGAVLDRQNKKVVFTAEGAFAKWNYVEISAENSKEYAISQGLKPGDYIIFDGNFDLVHDKPITVINMADDSAQ